MFVQSFWHPSLRLRGLVPPPGERAASVESDKPISRAPNGPATILIVEDDPGILDVARKLLCRYGYQVLTASGGNEAREVVERHGGAIDVLLSDVVMPGMSGPMVAAALIKIRPSMKVVFMSGYADDVIARYGLMERDVPFLQKPFTAEQLANKILEVLG